MWTRIINLALDVAEAIAKRRRSRKNEKVKLKKKIKTRIALIGCTCGDATWDDKYGKGNREHIVEGGLATCRMCGRQAPVGSKWLKWL